MGFGIGRKLLRLIFWVLNFSIWAASIVLISLGSWMLADSAEFDGLFADDKITPVAGILLGLGCFCFIVGFCGCRGLMLVRDDKDDNDRRAALYLKVYWGLMLIVVLGEIVCGSLLIAFSDEVTAEIEEGMYNTIQEDYGDEAEAGTATVDRTQEEYECCGAKGPSDYENSAWESQAGGNDGKVPGSCCRAENVVRCNPVLAEAYIDGCAGKVGDQLSSNMLVVGGITLAIIVVEVIAMVISCGLLQDLAD